MAEKFSPRTITVLGRYQDTIYWDAERGFWRNPARADRVIAFIECLTIPSGVGAGDPFKLRKWQKKFIRDIYEPVGQDFARLVREAILSMGRKNGKTAIIAALVLVHLVGPEAIANGEIYSAANDKDQAAIVFKFAAQFVRADPELDAAHGGLCKVIDSTKRITCPSNGSFYRALSRESKTKHGLNPSMAIYDELGQAIDRDLYDTLNTADGARDEFLFCIISTQSRDPQQILSELIDRGISGNDPTIVCHLYAVPDEVEGQQFCPPCNFRFAPGKDDGAACPKCGGETIDGIFDESLWPLANPALGDFLLLKAMQKKARQALDSPSFAPSFKNLSLNQRVDATPSLISKADWTACRRPESALIDGEEIYLGLDLSATTDLCALVAASAHNGTRLEGWFWKPKELLGLHETRDRAPYGRWVEENYLIAAPGRDVDYDLIATQIAHLGSRFKIVGIAYDRWRMDVLLKCFARLGLSAYCEGSDDYPEGVRFVEWGQGYKDMGPAVDALEKAVSARTLAHRGHPVLTWCFSNAVAAMDPAGNRKLDKSKARFRIDGAVAATMAIGLKARDMPEEEIDLSAFLANPISVRA